MIEIDKFSKDFLEYQTLEQLEGLFRMVLADPERYDTQNAIIPLLKILKKRRKDAERSSQDLQEAAEMMGILDQIGIW